MQIIFDGGKLIQLESFLQTLFLPLEVCYSYSTDTFCRQPGIYSSFLDSKTLNENLNSFNINFNIWAVSKAKFICWIDNLITIAIIIIKN